MGKALSFLKRLQRFSVAYKDENNMCEFTIDIDDIKTIEDAIAELEAPSSCDGCRYEKCDDHIEYRMNCGLCYRKITTPDYYQPKDIE